MIDPPAVPLAPGWYDDPESPARLRYFDGAAWTERTSDRSSGPSTPPVPAPASPAKSSNVALWIVVGLLAVIAAPFALAMFAASGADDDLSDMALGLQVALETATGTPLALTVAGVAVLGLGWILSYFAKAPAMGVVASLGTILLSVAAIEQWRNPIDSTGWHPSPTAWILLPAVLLIVGAVVLLWRSTRRRPAAAAS